MSSSTSKNMILGAAIATGLCAVTAIADIVMKSPYNGRMMFDITLLLGSGCIFYLCWESWKDLR